MTAVLELLEVCKHYYPRGAGRRSRRRPDAPATPPVRALDGVSLVPLLDGKMAERSMACDSSVKLT